MNILIAPGPYKECLSSKAVAEIIESGIRSINPDYDLINLPLCDGGIGFMERLVESNHGRIIPTKVIGPLGHKIETSYGSISHKKIAVIESALVCGLTLVKKEMRNPLLTTTYGIGQLIKEVYSKGYKRILIGMGDSSTNDGGVGALQALGIRFLDEENKDIGFGGRQILRIKKIDLSNYKKQDLEIIVACNLTSILCGEDGTSVIYGPQKGATPEAVSILSSALEHYASCIWHTLREDVCFLPGGGGAGGLSTGLYSFLGAKLNYSMDVVSDSVNLEEKLHNVDLIITGEGKIDDRTAGGKIACGVALLGKKYNIPSIAIVGQISEDIEDVYYNGIDYIQPILKCPITLEESIRNAEKNIFEASQRITRILPFLKKKEKYDMKPEPKNLSKNEKISTLLFDLGNTLVYIPDEYDMEKNMVREIGFRDEDSARSLIYSLCKAKTNLSTDKFITELSREINKSKKKIEDICYREINGAKISDGAIDILINFKKKRYNLVLVSNTPPTTKKIIKRFGLDKFFDTITLSCDVGYLKPDPRIFQIALQNINATPYETCVIGDKIRTDILGGKILGTKTVLLEKRSKKVIYNDPRIPVEAIITKLEDLCDLPLF